jgi:hypothetical protein
MMTRSEGTDERRTRPPSCWSKDEDAEFLRVDLGDGTIFLLPYRHLEYARLENVSGETSMKLFFSSHVVQIGGRNLIDLVREFQQRSVSSISLLPDRFAPLLPKEAILIERLEVEEVDQDPEPQSS